MKAMKEALKRKMQEHAGKKPELEIAIGMGKPAMDMEHSDGMSEGDPMYMDKKKLREENDLAPESSEEKGEIEMGEEPMGESAGEESDEKAMLQEILQALADRSQKGRGPMGLAERAAMGAKDKLNLMKK